MRNRFKLSMAFVAALVMCSSTAYSCELRTDDSLGKAERGGSVEAKPSSPVKRQKVVHSTSRYAFEQIPLLAVTGWARSEASPGEAAC